MMLVTGANGMVGSYLQEVFENDLILTDIPEMDVTDKEKVCKMISEHKPEYVLHLAAETNVDKCEGEIEHAFKVNAIGTQNVALACLESGSTMIYISTGGVFNGIARQAHTEYDIADPVNVYGKAKLDGEKYVASILKNYYIFRAGWMIGGGPSRDKKFVGKIVELSKTRDVIEAVDDKFGSLTYAKDFLKGIKKLIGFAEFGLYHLANGGICSRYEIAVEIAKNIKPSLRVDPVSSDRFPLPAPRAHSEAMENHRLNIAGANPMQKWNDALAEYLKEWPK